MGISKMKFTLLSFSSAWVLTSCDDPNMDGLGSNDAECTTYGAQGYCPSGQQCLKEACCARDNTAGGEGSGIGCRFAVTSCGSPYRRVLKEEDDFDSLDDLELNDGAPGFG